MPQEAVESCEKIGTNQELTFLYIEDDEVDVKRLSRLLSKQDQIDCKLDSVSSLEKSYPLIESRKYDAIFLDLNLPDCFGIETIRVIRDKAPKTPIILVTGTNDINIARQAIQEGAQDYLVKEDINIKFLVKSVHHSIQRQNLINQLHDARQREHILATHDPLTGLANRVLLDQYLASNINRCRRNKSNFAVMFVDLDRFKSINDRNGHAAGDHVLQVAASRLKKHLRESDFVSRVGGDEFICVIQETDQLVHITNIAKNLLTTLSSPIHYQYNSFSISASIGIAIFPTDSANSDTLIKCADSAMYEAKRNGRNGISFFNAALRYKSEVCINAEDSVKFAIDNEQLDICFQPIFHSRDNKLYSLRQCQAVLCWKKDIDAKMDMPDLIAAAQETEICIDIDEYLLRGVVSKYVHWRAQGIKDVVISVNISPRSLLRGDFLDRVQTLLKKNNIHKGNWLEMVVPEKIFYEFSQTTGLVVKKLSHMGIGIAVAGFGQNIKWLHTMDCSFLSSIRIDKSYLNGYDVEEEKSDKIIAIYDFARHFAREVVFEGVESPRQDTMLNKLQYYSALGDYYSSPLPGDKMQNILKTSH